MIGLTTTRLLNMLAPVNWLNPHNRGLVARWQSIPGLTGGSRFVNIVRPGDKDWHHGTLSGGPTWVGPSGRPGGNGALSLDGSDDFVDASSLDLYDLYVATGWSMMGWVKPVASVESTFITQDVDASNKRFIARINATGSVSYLYETAYTNRTTTGTPITMGAWNHLAYVVNYPASTLKVFVNGIEAALDSATITAFTAGDPILRIGKGRFGLFTGQMDDIRITRVLTASEVWGIYHDSRLGSPNTLNWIDMRGGLVSIPHIFSNFNQPDRTPTKVLAY